MKRILLLVLCMGIVVASVMTYSFVGDNISTKVKFDTGMKRIEPVNLPLVNQFAVGDLLYKEGTVHEPWEKLKAQNNDIVGWINIMGTKIDYPVVKGTDNDYYLKHGVDKKLHPAGRGYFGSIFMDYRVDENRSRNVVIYGHRMGSSGTMFTHLKYYYEVEQYKRMPYIKFDTPEAIHTWQIFSVMIIDANSPKEFDFRKQYFNTDKEWTDFITECKRRSLINMPVEFGPDDRIITLQTCTYEIANARLVVMARMVNAGESIALDVSKAEKNPNPLQPAAWYKKYGGKKPVFAD